MAENYNKQNLSIALLKSRIVQSGLKKSKIAESLGICPDYLGMILNGRRKPKELPKYLIKINKIVNQKGL